MKKVVILLIGLLFCITGFARTYEASVKLLKIEQLQTLESGGEEIFLHITAYHSNGKSESMTLPRHPSFWPSEHLEKVSDVDVWDGILRENESVVLLISAMEKDFHPWNTDDLIGTIRLRMINMNGRLKSEWSIPNSIDMPENITTKYGRGKKIIMQSDGRKYALSFASTRKATR